MARQWGLTVFPDIGIVEFCPWIFNGVIYKVLRVTGKVHNVTVLEVTEGEYRYSSTLSLTSALNAVSGQPRAPAALHPLPTLEEVLRIVSEI
jgi:hypothetical protein